MMRASILLFLLASLAACDTRRGPLPKSTGAQGEVLVVMPNGHWQSDAGIALRAVLERPLGHLPQREPRFHVVQVDPSAFGNLLRTHHNLFIATIGADSTGVRLVQDLHAQGQVAALVDAPAVEAWIAQVNTHGERIADAIDRNERDRLMARARATADAGLTRSVGDALGFTVSVPPGFRVLVQDASFAWLRRDKLTAGAGLEHDVIENLMLYQFPYVSDSTFQVGYLMDQRDVHSRLYVEGPAPGSHMIVQRAFEHLDLTPETGALTLDGSFAYRMRGLWGMAGAKMGGAFVSISRVDTVARRVITADGFVYAPQFDKREYIRELEAICATLRVVDPANR